MNTRSGIWSYGLATLLIEDILYNHTSTPLEFRRNRMRERFGVEFQAESYLAADGLLSYAVFRRADLTVVTLDGIETVAHGLRLNRGYAVPPERGHPYPANQFFVDNAVNIWGACSLSGCNMQGPLIVAGHSGGGAIAEVLAAYWKRMGNRPYVRCFTFGAPRAGGRAHTIRMNAIENVRFMDINDCIPYLPAHYGQGEMNRFFADAGVVRSWDAYQHSHGGRWIPTTGDPYEVRDVIPGGATNASDALAFFSGASTRLNEGHSRNGYVSACRRIAVQEGDVEFFDEDLVPMRRLLPDPGPILPPVAVQREAFIHAAAVRFDSQTLPTPVDPVFRYEKRNGLHCVIADDQMIDTFLSKLQARQFCRNMNRALRSWNGSVFGNATAFVAAVRNNFLGEL